MSTILMRREIPTVCFDSAECGVAFANAGFDIQAAFLSALASEVHSWGGVFSWPQQCRYIASEMQAEDRAAVASVLNTLLEHLEEPQT